MKCQNCKCQVSSEFKHSFTTNCCPKCGSSIMKKEVKELFLKMDNVLQQENNDIGDLAIWLVDTYLPSILPKSETDQDTSTITSSQEIVETNAVNEAVTVTKKQSILNKNNKEQQLIDKDRTSLFAKRAGVDRIKYETLVKDIQSDGLAAGDIGDDSFDDVSDFETIDEPLSDYDINAVENLFTVPSNKFDLSEIKKLQRLEELSSNGSVGLIKRSS